MIPEQKRLVTIDLDSACESDTRSRHIHVWHWGKEGAGAKFSHELARHLDDLPKTSVTLLAAEGSDLARNAGTTPEIAHQLIRIFKGDKSSFSGKIAAGMGVLRMPAIGSTFHKSIQNSRPDIALCAFPSIWDVAALPTLRRFSGRFILVLHDAIIHPGDDYPFRQSVLKWVVDTADALIVLSDHVGRTAESYYQFPRDRIFTVPHGAFFFDNGDVFPRQFPASRPFRLLFFGRILAYKGLGHLLDAYRQLQLQGFSLELDIVGSGDLSPYASRLNGLQGVRISNQWVDDATIATAFKQADAVVLPYIEASQSGVAAGAMAAALPIIATPIGGLKEQVIHQKTGLIASGMSCEHLAQAIQRMATSPTLYELCSAGALRHARSELDWSRVAEKVDVIMDDVAARPRRKIAK